ncbi:MAG: hypothetical protein AB4038_04205 [Prochloraceae cyanobacterium]
MALLLRQVANIYVPPVDVLEDRAAFDELFELHVEQKRLLQDLLVGGVDHEEVLEALEAYIGTSHMDNYIERVEPRLDLIFSS